MIRRFATSLILLSALACPLAASAETLEVGFGKKFARIEDAAAKARPGDVVLVHGYPNGRPFEKTAVLVRQPNITFRAVPARGAPWVQISGQGFNYSGAGSTPRAIFQFDPAADGCVLEGFELSAAHNNSHNGAGVRINQANRVTVRNCSIHNNDMGIMSNGDGTPARAIDQRIEHCQIHHNGDPAEPGYNHNLYLGGTSVTVRFCEIHGSLTGHNVKSRAHNTRVEYCYVHHSANREFDLVDAQETTRPESYAVLLGNIIVKDPRCKGNRSVIHFGQDGGRGHDGTLHLAFNTIVTPFISPVVELSAPTAKARLTGNIVSDGGARQAGQALAAVRAGAKLPEVRGEANVLAGSFSIEGTRLEAKANRQEPGGGAIFVNPAKNDYRLVRQFAPSASVKLPGERLDLPRSPRPAGAAIESPLAWQYLHPAQRQQRPAERQPTAGAYAASSDAP